MKNRKAPQVVLGVNVTQQLIEAVLLQQVDAEVSVVRRIIRPRKLTEEFARPTSLSKALPGLTGDDADYSLEIGSNGNGHLGSGADVGFLGSEFARLGTAKKEGEPTGSVPTANQRVPFASQLSEILDECRIGGYAVQRLAFCVAPPDVSYIDLIVPQKQPADRTKPRRKADSDVSRRSLLESLHDRRSTSFDDEIVGFLPAVPTAEGARYVAVVPEPTESVSATLEVLTSQKRELPPHRLMDAELPAYVRLARRMIPADRGDKNTAIIRVGSEDTLVLFFRGRDLLRFERLRSLTSYDSPDTICSRVLLQQDEWKIGDIQHLLVLSEARNEQLLDVFRRYYSDAAVETMQDAVGALKVRFGRETDVLTAGAVPAVLAALRMLQDWDHDDPELAFRLLPRKLIRAQKEFAIAWHTVAMMVILTLVAFALTWRYVDRQAEIERQRSELRQNPISLGVDNPALLKARVDSLRMAYATYTHALHVIDSLLVGSDRWTRLHERLTRSTRDVGGIWLTAAKPLGPGSIRIEGTASTRTGVAQFVRRHQGSIEKAASVDIKNGNRDVTVYEFAAVVPLPSETPRVALYLQDVAAGHVADADVAAVLTAYEAEQ